MTCSSSLSFPRLIALQTQAQVLIQILTLYLGAFVIGHVETNATKGPVSTQSVSRSIILGLFAHLRVIVRLKLTAIKLVIVTLQGCANGSSNREKSAINISKLILAVHMQTVLMELVIRLTISLLDKLYHTIFMQEAGLLLFVPQDTQLKAQMDSITVLTPHTQTLLK